MSQRPERGLLGLRAGLNLFANYTHIKTEGTYDNGAAALANFVPTSYNWGVSYAFKRLQVRVAMNHLSPYLLQFSPDPIAAAIDK